MVDPTSNELARQLAVLEERMNTHQAKYETALERLEANMARRDADHNSAIERLQTNMANWKTDMANWKADMAGRETRILLAVFGMIALATAILGFLIRLPNPAS